MTTSTYTIDDKVATVVGPVNFGEGSQPNPTSYVYDSMRRVQQVTDPQGRVATTVYDLLSRPTSSAVNGVTQQTVAYNNSANQNGTLKSVTDANNNVTNYAYDGLDRSSTVTYPDSSTESVQYDETNRLDNVLSTTTRAGVTFTFVYDNLNRLTSKTPAGGVTTSFTYDLASRVNTVSTPQVTGDPSTGTFKMVYDTAGRMYQEQYLPDGVTIDKQITATLDANGNATGLTYPSYDSDNFVVSSAFDQLDRVWSISITGASVLFGFDSASRRVSQLNGNSTAQGYRFDQVDNLMAMTFGGLNANNSVGCLHGLTLPTS